MKYYITVDRTWLDAAAEEGYIGPPIKIAFSSGLAPIAVYEVDWGQFRVRYSPDGAPVGNPRFVWLEADEPFMVLQELDGEWEEIDVIEGRLS